MKDSLKQWTQDLVQASNALERNTSDLKRRYFLKNIERFNQIASTIRGSRGSFGTGYPFYALSEELQGPIPVILEQIRYNDELIEYAENSKHDQWICEECLSRSYKKMPNLKQVCKPCPNMDSELKPRKIINRLPDIDMWMVCEDGCLEEAKVQLAEALKRHHISPSDIRPVRSIMEVEQIIETLGKGEMPEQFLPVDVHIMEYSKMKELIRAVPKALQQAKAEGKIPYLPISPVSYRKVWEYDEAYNFIYDFLSAFTPFNFERDLEQSVSDTRATIARKYTASELYTFLVVAATPANRRRFRTTPELGEKFFQKVSAWKRQKNKQTVIKTSEEEAHGYR